MGEGKVWVPPTGVLVCMRQVRGSAVATGTGPWLTTHMLGASLGGWGGEQVSVSLSGRVCMECGSIIQQQTPSWIHQQPDAPCWSKNVRPVESMGTGGCGVSVQWGCESGCHFAASPELDQLANQGPKGWARGSGVLAGASNGQKGCAVLRESVTVHVHVSLGTDEFVPTQEIFGLCQPRGRRGRCSLCFSDVSPMEAQHLCAASHVHVLYVSCVSGTSVPLSYGMNLKRKRGSHIPQPGQRPQVSGAPAWAPEIRQEKVLGQISWRWGPPLTTPSNNHSQFYNTKFWSLILLLSMRNNYPLFCKLFEQQMSILRYSLTCVCSEWLLENVFNISKKH